MNAPRRRRSNAAYWSRLAAARIRCGVSQVELASAVGVSLKTIRRLESGKLENPGIRLIQNIAIALDVPVATISDPAWQEWYPFDPENAPRPPGEGFVRFGRLRLPKRVAHLYNED